MDDQTQLAFAPTSHNGEGEIMSTLTKRTRKQIERHIEQCAESIQKNGLEIGRDLIEIRDEELWADEYESWTQYAKERLPELMPQFKIGAIENMVKGAEVEKRIPENIKISAQTSGLNHSHFSELARLAPQKNKDFGAGKEKDYSKLRKQDVARVIKNATEIAKESLPPEKHAEATPSVRDIRKAVDAELGIDREAERKKAQRKAEAERRKAQQEFEAENELSRVIHRLISHLEDSLADFTQVPAEGWEWLEDHKPGLCQQLANACDELAAFMRG